MKIDSQGSNFDPALQAGRTEGPRRPEVNAAERSATHTQPDAVRLSPDAKLASTAVQAATRSADIRQDVVERAKQLMAGGEVGNDPHRLADALIDRMLSTEPND